MRDWLVPRQYVSDVLRVPPDVPLALMDLSIGVLLVLGGAQRASSPAFAQARDLVSIETWGAIFVLLGVALLIAIRLPRRETFVSVTRILGPTLCVMWAVMFLVSGVDHPDASLIGVPAFLYLAGRHHYAPVRPA